MNERVVVIAGGGPTGLMLAGELALAGVDVVIVERRTDQHVDGSRAGGLHSRTIEVLDQRGIAERFLSAGQAMQVQGFAGIPLDISDFPTRHNYGLALWQSQFEPILADWVGALGVPILRGREVVGFAQDDTGVDIEVSGGPSLRAEYLVGCDGGRSLVRRTAGIDFPGLDASEHPPTRRCDYSVYHPATREAWRAWLETHQDDTPGVWAVSWRSSTGRDTVPYDAIVEEALCVGWVDSTVNVLDDARSLQLVTPRKPRSTWARSNKERVARLEAQGRMRPRGRQAVEVAKANGWWHMLDDVEALREPDDLAASLDGVPAARRSWDAFPPSARKQMLFWVVSAARTDTRRRRIGRIVEKATRGERAQG
jgi:2-polyprenyl-6-methoxyphenol hydroxylase-like FAD-dependent oxidoreductase